jgi:hypothetical protein
MLVVDGPLGRLTRAQREALAHQLLDMVEKGL